MACLCYLEDTPVWRMAHLHASFIGFNCSRAWYIGQEMSDLTATRICSTFLLLCIIQALVYYIHNVSVFRRDVLQISHWINGNLSILIKHWFNFKSSYTFRRMWNMSSNHNSSFCGVDQNDIIVPASRSTPSCYNLNIPYKLKYMILIWEQQSTGISCQLYLVTTVFLEMKLQINLPWGQKSPFHGNGSSLWEIQIVHKELYQ